VRGDAPGSTGGANTPCTTKSRNHKSGKAQGARKKAETGEVGLGDGDPKKCGGWGKKGAAKTSETNGVMPWVEGVAEDQRLKGGKKNESRTLRR